MLIAGLGLPAQSPARSNSIINEACLENVAGFERAYTVTFYAAILAVVLGCFCPAGRASGQRQEIIKSPFFRCEKRSFSHLKNEFCFFGQKI